MAESSGALTTIEDWFVSIGFCDLFFSFLSTHFIHSATAPSANIGPASSFLHSHLLLPSLSSTMPVCTHRGCEQTYDEATNSDTACSFHPQGPIFHEGLKGWSCCSKRVTSFDQFLAIPGCSTGRHTDIPREDVPFSSTTEKVEVSSPATAPSKVDKHGTETYGSTPAPVVAAVPATIPQSTSTSAPPAPAPEPEPVVEEEDDLSVAVPAGKTCLRRGCGHAYVSEDVSRGDDVSCEYHSGSPVFHEGSKGWSCCSRKVLEFDEFLRLKGCRTTNQHLFVGAKVRKKYLSSMIQSDKETCLEVLTHN